MNTLMYVFMILYLLVNPWKHTNGEYEVIEVKEYEYEEYGRYSMAYKKQCLIRFYPQDWDFSSYVFGAVFQSVITCSVKTFLLFSLKYYELNLALSSRNTHTHTLKKEDSISSVGSSYPNFLQTF